MITQTQIDNLCYFIINKTTNNEAYLVYNEWAINKSIYFTNIKDVEWCLNFIADILKIKQNKILSGEL